MMGLGTKESEPGRASKITRHKRALTEEQIKDVFVLGRYGLSKEEIAKQIGISEATAKQILSFKTPERYAEYKDRKKEAQRKRKNTRTDDGINKTYIKDYIEGEIRAAIERLEALREKLEGIYE